MNNPKRHHYLPQFYLRSFTKDRFVWVFDKRNNTSRKQKISDSAVIGHYHTIKNDSGLHDNKTIEQMMCLIEDWAKIAIENIHNETQSWIDKDNLSVFIAFIIFRTPLFENIYNNTTKDVAEIIIDLIYKNPQLLNSELRKLDQSKFDISDITPAAVRDFVDRGYTLTVPRTSSLLSMISIAPNISRIINNLGWKILINNSDLDLFTTDNPVVTLHPAQWKSYPFPAGLLTKDSTTLFPLSSKRCLAMSPEQHKTQFIHLDTSAANDINNLLFHNSFQYVFSGDEKTIPTSSAPHPPYPSELLRLLSHHDNMNP